MEWSTLDNNELDNAELVNRALDEAEAIIVGVGSGMPAADGFKYVGPRFENNFSDFIEKYNWLDLFQGSVFDFESLKEEWAFFSRFVDVNYLSQPLGESFVRMKQILEGRNYYIITTNADNAFEIADYDMDKVFHVQGKYNLMQCSEGCHNKRYPNEELMEEMIKQQGNMEVPSNLIPYCPFCGAPMELNRRDHDDYMIEDEEFEVEKNRFLTFLNNHLDKKILFLELGVGYMAPQIIKHPFQELVDNHPNALYMTVNIKNYRIPKQIRNRSIWINEDIRKLLKGINENEIEATKTKI